MSNIKKLLALITIPALLFLSGCEMTVKGEIQSEKSQKTSVELSYSKDELNSMKSSLPPGENLGSCKGLQDFITKSGAQDAKKLKVTDKSSGNNIKCLFENDNSDKKPFDVKEENNKLVITLGSDFARSFDGQALKQVSSMSGSKADVAMEITTPGKITEVKGVDAKANGNSIKFSLLEVKDTKAIKITCEKSSGITSAIGIGKGSSGGVILYVLIFVVILVAVVVVLLLVMNKRKQNNQQFPNSLPQNGYLPQAPYQPQGAPHPHQGFTQNTQFMPPAANHPGYIPTPEQPQVPPTQGHTPASAGFVAPAPNHPPAAPQPPAPPVPGQPPMPPIPPAPGQPQH